MILLLLKGFVVGFAIAAPIGPVGLLCIRRSIADGRMTGFLTGLWAAVADAMMAFVTAYGVSTILNFLAHHQKAFHLGGGIIIVMMGLAAIRSKPPTKTNAPLHARNLSVAFFSTIILTLANPVTSISLIAIFAGFGVTLRTEGWIEPAWLVFGVFLGSTAWWLILSHFADWFGSKLNTRLLKSINIGTGILLIGFGCYQLLASTRVTS